MPQYRHTNQHGATLLVSMVILLLLTVIGIASMSNSSMQSNMARNFQLGKTSSQLAETTIARIIFLASQGPSNAKITSYDPAKDLIRTVDISKVGNVKNLTFTEAQIDPDKTLGDSGTAAVASQAQFIWNKQSEMCPGGAGTGSCNAYTVRAAAYLDGVTANEEHDQNLWIVVPKAN